MAVSWSLAFNFTSLQTFTQQEFAASIIKVASVDRKLASISPNSYYKDAACIIHMYRPALNTATEVRCPFNALGLIETTSENGHFRFAIRERYNLPPIIFLATCFSYARAAELTGKTISLNQLVYSEDSPGVAFKLSETECGKLLDQAVRQFKDFHFVESAGVWQLHFTGDPLHLYWECLKKYYEELK